MSETMDETQAVALVDEPKAATATNLEVFSFGDPEPVLSRRDVIGLLESRWNGRWHETPYPLHGLAKAFRSSPHHSSAIFLKRNLLLGAFDPTPLLSRREFNALVLDYLVFGNCYLEAIPNRLGGTALYERAIAKHMRAGENGEFVFLDAGREDHRWTNGEISHLKQPCIDQEIYGVPEYLSALQSAFLNENATLFRRKYYLNGSHAGFILHLDGQFAEKDMKNLREQLREAKGLGNFKNLLLKSQGGTKDSVRLIPISEVAAKDEFLGIKNTTRDDVLAAHRVPPQLLGVVPANAGGFGDITKATNAFYMLEMLPLQMQFMEINDLVGREIVRFKAWERLPETGPAKAD
jgi:PBSX family phage portal protein